MNERLLPATREIARDDGALILWARLLHRRGRFKMRCAEKPNVWRDLGGEQ